MNAPCLLWAIRSYAVQREIQLAVKGTTFSEITLANLRRIRVPLPTSHVEQERIATAMQLCEHQTDQLGYSLAKYRELKNGLMQDLLTGKVRVNIDDEITEDATND